MTGSQPPSNPADKARVAVRLSSDYFMRSLNLIAVLWEGEVLTGLVSLAIILANIAHLDQAGGPGGAYEGLGDVPPDELRRPVSVLAISSTLGIPYETTRRHVAKLLEAGRCVRVKGGLIVPAGAISTPQRDEMIAANLTNLRRLFRALKAAGVPLD